MSKKDQLIRYAIRCYDGDCDFQQLYDSLEDAEADLEEVKLGWPDARTVKVITSVEEL